MKCSLGISNFLEEISSLSQLYHLIIHHLNTKLQGLHQHCEEHTETHDPQFRERNWALDHLAVQFSSVTQSCPTLLSPTDCSTPGFSVLYHLPEFAQICVHRVGDAIQPSHPLLPPFPPALNLSQHQGFFQCISSSHQVAKVLEFQLSISSSNEYSGLISFRVDWFDLPAVQGTLKSLL